MSFALRKKLWTRQENLDRATPTKSNSSPLKNDARKTILSVWGQVTFSGAII